MTTYRVKKQHVRNWCFKGPVKTKPSFSRIKLHVWAVVTTFYYSTSYTLLEPSGTSHGFSDQNYFPEYLRTAMRLMIERILFIPPEPSPCATSACSSPGIWWGRPHHSYSRNTNIAMWLFPRPWNTSTEALHPSSWTQHPKLAVILRHFHNCWRGCAWTQLPSFS